MNFWGYSGIMGLLLFIFWANTIITPIVIASILYEIAKTLNKIHEELKKKNTPD